MIDAGADVAVATLCLGGNLEVMRGLPPESADLVFADPPYILVKKNTYALTRNKPMYIMDMAKKGNYYGGKL